MQYIQSERQNYENAQAALDYSREEIIMASSRRKFNFGYPDSYGAAHYPPAYDAAASSTAFLQYQFRAEQEDMAPPNTAIKDEAGDRAQKEYAKKYAPAYLPPHSGLNSYKGFGHDKGNFDYVFFQSEIRGEGALSFSDWLRKRNLDPNKFPKQKDKNLS